MNKQWVKAEVLFSHKSFYRVFWIAMAFSMMAVTSLPSHSEENTKFSSLSIFSHTMSAGFNAAGLNSCVDYNQFAGVCIYFDPNPLNFCLVFESLREMWSPDLVVDITSEPYESNITEMQPLVQALIELSKPLQDRGINMGKTPVAGGIQGPLDSTLAAQFNSAHVYAHPASLTWHKLWNVLPPKNFRHTCVSQSNKFLQFPGNVLAYASEMDRQWRDYEFEDLISGFSGRMTDDNGNDWGKMIPLTGFHRSGTNWHSTLSMILKSGYLSTSKPLDVQRGMHNVLDLARPPLLGGMATRRCGGIDCVGPKAVQPQKKSDDGYYGKYLHHGPLPGGDKNNLSDMKCQTLPTTAYDTGNLADTKGTGSVVGTIFRHYSCCPPPKRSCPHFMTIPSIKR